MTAYDNLNTINSTMDDLVWGEGVRNSWILSSKSYVWLIQEIADTPTGDK